MTDLEQSAMIEHHDMTAPTTRAGKAFIQRWTEDDDEPEYVFGRDMREQIAAIEAEARAEGAKERDAMRCYYRLSHMSHQAILDAIPPGYPDPEAWWVRQYHEAESAVDAILAATEDGTDG